jgi:SAM-dependent methyltransferase
MGILEELSDKYPHFDKKAIGYLPLYEMIFLPIRTKAKKVLEIGVQSGNSIRLWKNFFPETHVYGWDIDPASMFKEDRITTSIINHDDKVQVSNALKSIGEDIDVVIDDGSHRMNSQQSLLAWCLKHVRSGGIYVTEDIGTSFPTKGASYGLAPDGSNSTYKCLDTFVYTGKFYSTYVSREEKSYIEDNTKVAFMYSTIRKIPDGFPNLTLESWPTFPIFVLIKS